VKYIPMSRLKSGKSLAVIGENTWYLMKHGRYTHAQAHQQALDKAHLDEDWLRRRDESRPKKRKKTSKRKRDKHGRFK